MKKRQWIISAVLTLFIILLGAGSFQFFKSKKQSTVGNAPVKEEIRTVSTQRFEPQNIKSKVQIDGRLSAFEKIDIFAEVTGKLVDNGKRFREGSYFSKDDVLFEIDNNDEEFNLFAQRSALLTSITQIMPDLKFDYPEAFEKWKKYLDEFDVKKSVKTLPEVDSQQEKYFVAGKNIYNLFYNIKGLEDRMGNYQVYAPFSGVFLTVNKFPGALVTPGQSLGQLMNTGRYELVAPINFADFKFIERGQKVQLYSEELGKEWSGSVSRISNQIDQATQSIPVYISVTGKGLRDGLFLKGSLDGSEINDATNIPKSAIFDNNKIFVLKDSILASKKIDIISRTDEEIVAKGINATDNIVVSGVNNLYNGQKVMTQN